MPFLFVSLDAIRILSRCCAPAARDGMRFLDCTCGRALRTLSVIVAGFDVRPETFSTVTAAAPPELPEVALLGGSCTATMIRSAVENTDTPGVAEAAARVGVAEAAPEAVGVINAAAAVDISPGLSTEANVTGDDVVIAAGVTIEIDVTNGLDEKLLSDIVSAGADTAPTLDPAEGDVPVALRVAVFNPLVALTDTPVPVSVELPIPLLIPIEDVPGPDPISAVLNAAEPTSKLSTVLSDATDVPPAKTNVPLPVFTQKVVRTFPALSKPVTAKSVKESWFRLTALEDTGMKLLIGAIPASLSRGAAPCTPETLMVVDANPAVSPVKI